VQVTVSLTVELPTSGDIDSLEPVVLDAGRRAMAAALQAACREYESRVLECPHCQSTSLQSEGTDRRVVLCSFGRVELFLRLLRCEHCTRRFRPGEQQLACLAGANVSAQLRQACVLAGASWPYATAATVLQQLCGARISAETVRQLTQRAGTAAMQTQAEAAVQLLTPTAATVRAERATALAQPVVPAPAPELLMVGLDGGWVPSREQPGGMEGKVGVVATEVEPIGGGRRRLVQRRYVATFGASERVGALTYAAAQALGGEEAQAQVVLGDGAPWIKTQAALHFPRATPILDWPHLARAVHRAIRAARPGARRRTERRALHHAIRECLWGGEIDAALLALRALRPAAVTEPVPALDEAIAYVEAQRTWLGDYQAWQDAGYPVGSGLVERAVELVINRRLKRRGMRWRRDNADAVVALRVLTLNAEWDATSERRAVA
jgi:hypothetical protein